MSAARGRLVALLDEYRLAQAYSEALVADLDAEQVRNRLELHAPVAREDDQFALVFAQQHQRTLQPDDVATARQEIAR